MRILWLSGAALDFAPDAKKVFRCGWYQTLMETLFNRPGITMGCAFDGSGEWGKQTGNITVYPIPVFEKLRNRIRRQISPSCEEELLLPEVRRVIREFQPDVIHIWGTEYAYGLICRETKVPCILHVQGLLNPYRNAFFPPGISRNTLLSYLVKHPRELEMHLRLERVRHYREERELRILKSCSNYFIRTEWDAAVTKFYRPDSRLFYCSELLRKAFMTRQGQWRPHDRKRKKIVSVISMPYYKGHDLILKTADLLTRYTGLDFSWEVYGVHTMQFWEEQLNLSCGQVHVLPRGLAGTEELAGALLDADLFVHPSYIDNSPNSLCEAQILGLPVIACCTGGVPSLVDHGKNGLLVPCNDPWQSAFRIRELIENREHALRLGREAAVTAARRHDPETVLRDLLNACGELMRK